MSGLARCLERSGVVVRSMTNRCLFVLNHPNQYPVCTPVAERFTIYYDTLLFCIFLEAYRFLNNHWRAREGGDRVE